MIVAYIGDRGSGKSLAMTIKLYNDFYKKDRMIYSNYGLRFPNEDKITALDKQFFEDFKKSDFQIFNCAVAIDEAHVFIDSRRSMSPRNIMFSKFITQSRKREVDLYYTTQDVNVERFMSSGQVEMRLRKLTDEVIFCKTLTIFGDKSKKPETNYEHFIDVKKDKMYSLQFTYRGGLLKKKSCILANKYMKLYDSNEIVDFD